MAGFGVNLHSTVGLWRGKDGVCKVYNSRLHTLDLHVKKPAMNWKIFRGTSKPLDTSWMYYQYLYSVCKSLSRLFDRPRALYRSIFVSKHACRTEPHISWFSFECLAGRRLFKVLFIYSISEGVELNNGNHVQEPTVHHSLHHDGGNDFASWYLQQAASGSRAACGQSELNIKITEKVERYCCFFALPVTPLERIAGVEVRLQETGMLITELRPFLLPHRPTVLLVRYEESGSRYLLTRSSRMRTNTFL
jgi:hypothetical protein